MRGSDTHGEQAMASMTFRFTTECELTLDAESYEEAYLKFKDFMHGESVQCASAVTVLPPETVQIFFQTDRDDGYYEIDNFKGDFRSDIMNRCGIDSLILHAAPIQAWQLRNLSLEHIPEVYW